MADFEVTIEPHPAQARHPNDKSKALTQDGKPVPLFPDERCIRLDGKLIGYVGNASSGRAVMFIVPESKLTEAVTNAAKTAVVAEFGALGEVLSVPEKPKKKKRN